MQETPNTINNLIELAKIGIPAITTLLAGLFGYFYGNAHLKSKIKLDFVEKQLSEFYSPMIGCLKRIRALSELRLKISKKSDVAWKKICAEQKRPFLDHENYFEPFKKSIEHDNQQFRKEIIPLYDEMVRIFQEKYWLASQSTQRWYSDFLHFVEVWHRWLNKTIPAEVVQELNHSEESLKPFYKELQDQLGKLQKELAGK